MGGGTGSETLFRSEVLMWNSSSTCSTLTSTIFTRRFPRLVTAQTSALKTTSCTEKVPRFWICVQIKPC